MTDVDVGNSNWNDMEHVLPEGIGHGDPTRTGTTGTSWSWARRRRGASLAPIKDPSLRPAHPSNTENRRQY